MDSISEVSASVHERDRVSCTSGESVCMKQGEAVYILHICVVLVTCMCACAHSG